MAAHRYWRVRATALDESATRMSLNEIFFLGQPYGPDITSLGTLTADNVETGNVSWITNGILKTGGLNNSQFRLTTPFSIEIDFGGTAREVAALVLWPMADNFSASNGRIPTAIIVEHSDDGSSWTTAWTDSWTPPATGQARLKSNWHTIDPGAAATQEYPFPRLADSNLLFAFEADHEAWSDTGTTPAENGDPVRQWGNKGAGADAVQATLARRPIYRTGGLQGLPYIEGNRTDDLYFEDIAFTQPSGLSSLDPYILAAVTDAVDLTSESPLMGSTASSGGKVGAYFRSNAGSQVRVAKNNFAGLDIENPQFVLGAPEAANAIWLRVNTTLERISTATNFTSTAISATQFLRNTGLSGDPSFEGRLYAFALYSGLNVRPHVEFDLYMRGKYFIGWAGSAGEVVEPGVGQLHITGQAPALVIDQFVNALPGSLVLTGGTPLVVLDELIAVGAEALAINGLQPDVFSGITLQPGAGDLVITGIAPLVTTFQFAASSQFGAVALAETDQDAAASQFAAVALAEIIPQSNLSQMAQIALAEVIPPVAASQAALVVLGSGEPCATRRAQFWKITRTDGVVIALTSHDRPHEIDGLIYSPCNSLTPSASAAQAEMGAAGDMELSGILSTEAISSQDLQAGLYDDAYVEVFYQSWDDPADIVRILMAGWMGGASHGEEGFRADVIGPAGRLAQRPLTQLYTPACRWRFGDERCGVDIDALGLSGTVASVQSRDRFAASVTGTPGSAQYASGRVRWLTGANAGAITEVKDYDAGTGRITLWVPAPFAPSAGDSFDLLPGCDQLRETCRDVYANIVRFGGFPDVPGDDNVVETPAAKY